MNNKIYIQIGTNDGNDSFNKMIKKEYPYKTILIEPNKLLNNKIYDNYNGIPNIYLENVAITTNNESNVKLSIPKNDINGKSINGISYNDKHFSLIPMDDWGDDFNTIETIGMSFNELCKKYNVTDIYYLQIDTEGYDSEIIKSIDFDNINIETIKYENWGFGEDCFKRYGEDGKKYGINAIKTVTDILESKGYIIENLGEDTIAKKIKK